MTATVVGAMMIAEEATAIDVTTIAVIITVQVAADTTIEMAATGKSAFVAPQAHPLINFFYS